MTSIDKPLKVFIPAAGTGSRLGIFTKYLNKALIDISGKPAISRIIDMFPDTAEFVIALGYKVDLIKQFLPLAYPDRKFYFAQVSKYEGEGSGLGLTILSAEKYLMEPFIFCACDTIVLFHHLNDCEFQMEQETEQLSKIKEQVRDDREINYGRNTAFYSERENTNQYRTIDIKNGKVSALNEKNEAKETSMPYIGLCCIKDCKLFWEEMHKGGDAAIQEGESYALKKFAQKGILYAQKAEWFDIGNLEELEKTRAHFKQKNAPNILPKPDEAIWFINDNVIKYSNNTSFIKERVLRAHYLKGFVPEITAYTDNMYAYKKIDGIVLSKIQDISLFKKLLDYSNEFWQKHEEPENFKEICKKFYYDKTLERIDLYYKTFSQEDNETVVNGRLQPKLSEILSKLDWDNICSGSAGQFHGDFHFENILYNEKTDKFTFLDHRQNFGGLIETGDIYYDLAKLLHGLIICHELIAANKFDIDIDGGKNYVQRGMKSGAEQKDNSEKVQASCHSELVSASLKNRKCRHFNAENAAESIIQVNYSFERKPILIECEKYYYDWLNKNGYDVKKVKILTALIYLNIAALHHNPYCHLLYYLGKDMLYENI